MELFPAQPDLSLQISPPNAKSSTTSSSSWRSSNNTTSSQHHHQEDVDFGFWKRALDSTNSVLSLSNNNNKPTITKSNTIISPPLFDLSLSSNIIHNSIPTRPSSSSCSSSSSSDHQHPHLHSFHYSHHLLFQQQSPPGQDLGFLRPIRGIPLYHQNPPPPPPHTPSSFPFHHGLPSAVLDGSNYYNTTTSPNSSLLSNNNIPPICTTAQAAAIATTTTTNNNTTSNCSSNPLFQQSQAGATNMNMMMRSRFLSRFPPKRSMRAPRMRWTSTLHARFVHAVELLGGHESIYLS